MSKLWLSILGCVVGTLVAAYLLPGVHAASYTASILVGVALGVLYLSLRPVVKFFTFPFAVITFGLLNVLIDGVLLMMVARFSTGYSFESFGWAIATALIVNLSRRICRSLAKR